LKQKRFVIFSRHIFSQRKRDKEINRGKNKKRRRTFFLQLIEPIRHEPDLLGITVPTLGIEEEEKKQNLDFGKLNPPFFAHPIHQLTFGNASGKLYLSCSTINIFLSSFRREKRRAVIAKEKVKKQDSTCF
jgi:hypothetical protein